MFIDMRARCFMEAARCLNFTRAAEKLYISQPALSKHIAALEDEVGMKLFYRDHKKNKVALTAAGAVLLCEFQKMEVILDGVIDKAYRAEAGQEGHLKIGLLAGQIVNQTTIQVLNHIAANYPKVQIEQITGIYKDLRMWLEDGTTDTIVTFEEEVQDMEGVLYEEVREVQLGFAVQRYMPLASKRTIKVKDLEGVRIIVPDVKETHHLSARFYRLCEETGFSPDVIVAPDLNRMNMMAEMGKGVLLTREDSIVTRSPNLKFYRSEEMGSAKLVAAWRRDNLNPIITFFHRMYEERYHKEKAEF